MTANFTYSWKPVNNTNFAVCIVVASSELDTKVTFFFLPTLTRKLTSINVLQYTVTLG